MKVGDQVKCIWPMRPSKKYAAFGVRAADGDEGTIVAITEFADATIVQFKAERGVVHSHIQNLLPAPVTPFVRSARR